MLTEEEDKLGDAVTAVKATLPALGSPVDGDAASVALLRARSLLLLLLKRWTAALDSLDQLVHRGQSTAADHLARAHAATELGQLDTALSAWEQAEELGVADPGGYLFAARLHLQAGDPVEADRCLIRATTLQSQSYGALEAWVLAGILALAAGRGEDAARRLNRALTADFDPASLPNAYTAELRGLAFL